MQTRRGVLVALLALVAGVTAWQIWWAEARDTRVIRLRLEALAEELNDVTASPEQRTAAIAEYFTEDVVVDFGRGTAPIRGRETLVSMAERLQPRTAIFELAFEDVDAKVDPDGSAAAVSLTATLTQRSITTRDESLDARELALEMARSDGEWRIAHVTAVETLKRN